MNKLVILLLYFLLTVTAFPYTTTGQVLDPAMIGSYIDRFNMQDKELYVQHISNGQAKEFLSGNIPLFECPDKNIEEIYYFRWWTFRKHLKKTPDGFIVTEFLPDVPWAGKHNGICCPAWFHFREGRWLKYSGFLKDYAYYWLKGGGDTHSYSFPVAHAIYQYCQITGNYQLLNHQLIYGSRSRHLIQNCTLEKRQPSTSTRNRSLPDQRKHVQIFMGPQSGISKSTVC